MLFCLQSKAKFYPATARDADLAGLNFAVVLSYPAMASENDHD